MSEPEREPEQTKREYYEWFWEIDNMESYMKDPWTKEIWVWMMLHA